MDDGFLKQLDQAIKQDELIQENEKVLIGVSGGPDSVALLHGLLLLSNHYRKNWRLFVVHVNHMLRGKESVEDAEFVAKLCEEKRVPYRIYEKNVKAYIQKKGGNKQAVARKLRYQAFCEVANDWGIQKIALAHHADDQVETILMRLLRGTSVSGLSGMAPIRNWHGLQIIRPMLQIFRAEIEAYLQTIASITPRYDPSNDQLDYTRNRVRHQLIPELLTYNPKGKKALLNLTEIARAEEEVWSSLTEQAMKSIIIEGQRTAYSVDVKKFLDLPVALQRRTVKLILDCLVRNGRNEIALETIERVREIFQYQQPSLERHVAGGVVIKKEYHRIQLTCSEQAQLETAQKPPVIKLKIPGETKLPGYNGKIEVYQKDKRLVRLNQDKNTAIFDADFIQPPILIRPRKNGDRMTCFGLKGSKKIKELMIEAKIPRSERDRYPIVVMNDRIIWIPGIRRSDFAPVTEQTKQVLCFVWRQNSR